MENIFGPNTIMARSSYCIVDLHFCIFMYVSSRQLNTDVLTKFKTFQVILFPLFVQTDQKPFAHSLY